MGKPYAMVWLPPPNSFSRLNNPCSKKAKTEKSESEGIHGSRPKSQIFTGMYLDFDIELDYEKTREHDVE